MQVAHVDIDRRELDLRIVKRLARPPGTRRRSVKAEKPRGGRRERKSGGEKKTPRRK